MRTGPDRSAGSRRSPPPPPSATRATPRRCSTSPRPCSGFPFGDDAVDHRVAARSPTMDRRSAVASRRPSGLSPSGTSTSPLPSAALDDIEKDPDGAGEASAHDIARVVLGSLYEDADVAVTALAGPRGTGRRGARCCTAAPGGAAARRRAPPTLGRLPDLAGALLGDRRRRAHDGRPGERRLAALRRCAHRRCSATSGLAPAGPQCRSTPTCGSGS